jgi:HEPN domain-containing protein
MTRREARDLAEILLSRAAEDETTLRKLVDDAEIADRILGLHAQQAVEKCLKAVLTAKHVRYGKTHNVATLVSLLDDADTDAPEWLHETEPLTLYATTIRYDEVTVAPLDRAKTVRLVQRVRSWAEDQVAQA